MIAQIPAIPFLGVAHRFDALSGAERLLSEVVVWSRKLVSHQAGNAEE